MELFQVDAFHIFDKQWALVTAGTLNHYNTMTISWGGLGTLGAARLQQYTSNRSVTPISFWRKMSILLSAFFQRHIKRIWGFLAASPGGTASKSLLPV